MRTHRSFLTPAGESVEKKIAKGFREIIANYASWKDGDEAYMAWAEDRARGLLQGIGKHLYVSSHCPKGRKVTTGKGK